MPVVRMHITVSHELCMDRSRAKTESQCPCGVDHRHEAGRHQGTDQQYGQQQLRDRFATMQDADGLEPHGTRVYSPGVLRRSALATTDTDDRLIASAASIGLSSQPKTG